MTDWVLKIIALLHDPPEKTLGLAGHQRRAFQLMAQVIGTQEFQTRFRKPAAELTRKDFEASTEGKRVKQADQIASAIDRAAFPSSVRLESVEFMQNPQVRHPFSGQPFRLERVSDVGEIQRQTGLVVDYVNRQTDPRKKYLALWRAMPLLVPDATTRLLPPDTRIVDHPLWAHLDATAALVTALPDVVMLHVGIGPVQGFIYEARRTQDLWMGSYLLSYLTWMGIKAVVERCGPDCIIYPSLRGQPLMDAWLKNELRELPPGVSLPDLTMATIPNKFVAVIPATEMQNGLPDGIVKAVRGAWREITQAVYNAFPGGPQPGEWEKIWNRQTQSDDWPEIYWSAVWWPNVDASPQVQGAEESLRIAETYLGEQEVYRKLLETYRQSWPAGTHTGTMYGALYRLLTAALDARKRSRDFKAREEDGEKCTVMPALSALRLDSKSRRAEVRAYWQKVAQALHGQNRAHEVKADGSERLSAVASVKRFAPQSYFRPHGIHLTFPSTSRLAAVPFYRQLLERLPEDSALQQRLHEHLDALDQLGYPKVSDEADEKALPALKSMVEALKSELRSLAKRLFQFEADVLYPERLAPDLLEREYGGTIKRQAAEKAQQTCRALRQAVGAPPTYYAILVMDGDDMGKWLAGEHAQMPNLQGAMHQEVLPKFKALPEPEQSNWNALLNNRHPLAANLHTSLSSALATFALRGVKFIIEERHFGRVVYAGGDDVLAFLPMTEALAAARELYMLFTGQARVINEKLEPDQTLQNGYVKWNDEILLMPGPRITLSAGLAIVHHLYPLDAALEAARDAEKAAKAVPGKSAVCVRVLKRSGETVQMCSKWESIGERFDRLVAHLAADRLSSRFAYDLSERARGVTALSADAQKAALKQLVGRHKTDALSDNEALALIEDLAQWAQALDGQIPPQKVDDAEIPQGLAELARWLILARFVAQGGEL
ncbi:MAG: type III-B CRISPR-associated protein Cas10/Cmr2 [Anaerolineae bacterium]|nr:type III-B CRISPR-associated protein Cas10/Cmr2 [Anaerolineae bacterium]